MFSNDSCLNITVFVLLILLGYVLYRNYYSSEGFAEKHHKHHEKHHKHHASHPSEKKSEEEEKKAVVTPAPQPTQQPTPAPIPDNLEINHLISKTGLVGRGGIPMILGDDGNNQFVMHTPQDGRKQLYITSRKADNSDWDWSTSLSLDHTNNTISTNGNSFVVNNGIRSHGNIPVVIGDDGNNQFVMHTPQDGRKALYLAPRKTDNTDWDWGSSLSFDYKNHTISTNGNYFVAQSGMASQGCDFVLGGACSRGDSGASRALVKDQGPQLVINYANDFKAGTRVDGDLHVNKLWIGDRWSLEPEGNVLVFRDNKTGGDNRYAMFPGQGSGKNL
jgi:hypothetical protein